jgi:hypothetical protein
MTKEAKIELLVKFIKGEIPASQLKQYTLICFLYMSKLQLSYIENITGPVKSYRSKYMPDGERAVGLFEGIPVGFTAWWHLSMVIHPNSAVELIDGRNAEDFNQFITKLKTEYEKRQRQLPKIQR